MRSGWWWGTPEWEAYQKCYYAGKDRPEEFKSSPLAYDHDLSIAVAEKKNWTVEERQSHCIDLSDLRWDKVRDSYHALINKAKKDYLLAECWDIHEFKAVHRTAFGSNTRPAETYDHNGKWLDSGNGLLVGAYDKRDRMGGAWMAFAFWIVYEGRAYYASGPSLVKDVMHCVIWKSLVLLKGYGIDLVDMGPPKHDKDTFKAGWGGSPRPYLHIWRKP